MRVSIELTHEQVDAVRQQIQGGDEQRLFGDEYRDYTEGCYKRGRDPRSYVAWLEDHYAADAGKMYVDEDQ